MTQDGYAEGKLFLEVLFCIVDFIVIWELLG